MMNKVVALVRSSTGSATQEWRDAVWPHVEAAAQALTTVEPAVTGLVVSRVVKPFADNDPLMALIEVWGDGVGAELTGQTITLGLRDTENLNVTAATCSEIVFKEVRDFARDGSPWSIKLAGTAFRREDFEPDAFFDYWTNVHAPIGGSVPGVGGYVVSRAHEGQLGEESADALIAQWYVDEQAFNDAQSTEPAQAAWKDVGNYAMTTGTAFWLMTESVIIEPPVTGPGILEV